MAVGRSPVPCALALMLTALACTTQARRFGAEKRQTAPEASPPDFYQRRFPHYAFRGVGVATGQDQRPPPEERRFNSSAIEAVIQDVTARMKDPVLAQIFGNAFPNTLDTTIELFGVDEDGFRDTFIITGDIEAMWFRDSTNQVAPYWPYVAQDPALRNLMCGLLNRQVRNVLYDPYANAFNPNFEGGPWQGDNRVPPMTRRLHEGKYELDSLAAVLKLSNTYYNWTRDSSCLRPDWIDAIRLILDTITDQQISSEDDWEDPYYRFNRNTEVATDTLMMRGRGPPGKGCGLSKCAFRPSDDATTFPYLIPANAMAVVELEGLVETLNMMGQHADVAVRAQSLAAQLRAAINIYGIVDHPVHGRIYAYEVDCYSSSYIMDDANIPSLLSLPYLGYVAKDDEVYLRTRSVILSDRNPFYFRGSAGAGIGGPHIGLGYIWPMGLSIQALTSMDDAEIESLLNTLKTTTADTFLMHESFWKDDPDNYTRSWFAWANSVFAELILTLARERPYLIFK